MTEDQPSPIANEEAATGGGRKFPPMGHETSSSDGDEGHCHRSSLKDADVQVMIDEAIEKAKETSKTEDEIQLLKLKLEEVTRCTKAEFRKVISTEKLSVI